MGGKEHVLGLLDDFEHEGPNGRHQCLVFKAMGPDMGEYRQLFARSRISLSILREVSRQLLLTLAFLHDRCHVIHTYIKPNNILIETSAINEMFQKAPSEVFFSEEQPPKSPQDYYMESTQVSSAEEDLAHSSDISVRLADLGSASWKSEHLTEWIQPQMLRAPEVTLGATWDHKLDIWNLGLIIWELAEGQLVFDGCWTPQHDYSIEAHLAQMTAIFGKMPRDLLDRSNNRRLYFNEHGDLIEPSPFPSCTLRQFSKNPNLQGREREEFLAFIESMVKLDPVERLEARELLRSPWLAIRDLTQDSKERVS